MEKPLQINTVEKGVACVPEVIEKLVDVIAGKVSQLEYISFIHDPATKWETGFDIRWNDGRFERYDFRNFHRR